MDEELKLYKEEQNLTDEEIQGFSKCFIDYGPFFDPSRIENEAERSNLEYIMYICRGNIAGMSQFHKSAPKIITGYINSSRLGAVAGMIDGNYYIGVYSGTVEILEWIYRLMMNSPNIFKGVGDIRTCQHLKIETVRILSAYRMADVIYDIEDKDYLPKDYFRARLAFVLALKAIEFLTLHECAHILYGHVGYIDHQKHRSMEDNTKLSFLEDAEKGLISQAMEYEADMIATFFYLFHLDLELPRYQEMNKVPFLNKYQNLLGVAVFAVISLFRIMGIKDYEAERLEHYSHPPPGMRAVAFSKTMFDSFAKGRQPMNQESGGPGAVFNKYLREVDQVFIDLSQSKAEADESRDSYIFAFKNLEHLNKVFRLCLERRSVYHAFSFELDKESLR